MNIWKSLIIKGKGLGSSMSLELTGNLSSDYVYFRKS